MKRIGSLLLGVLLLLSGCAPLDTVAASYLGVRVPSANGRGANEQPHTDLCFSALPDDAATLDPELARSKELLLRIDMGELSGRAAQRALEQRIDAYKALRTAASIAYVRYCRDIADGARKTAYDRLSNGLNALGTLLLDAQSMLCRDPALSDVYDAETVDAIERERRLHDASLQPLIEREQALIGAYDALASLTVSADGREWTRDAILSDASLDYAAFSELWRTYRHAYNERAGAIFLELIETRNAQARALGFDSYVAYGYAQYGRDYTPADAQRLSETVKSELVPLFTALVPAFYEATVRLGCGTFSVEPTLKRTETVVKSLLPELKEPWDYMLSHGMYDFATGETRMSGSFTTYFETYGAPFLFTSWDDSYEMPTTLLHEFGHYAGYYLCGAQRMAGRDPLDLAELDSQGLEMLAVPAYETLYGALTDAARFYTLTTALYAILTGCMEDAFQQYAYTAKAPTVETLNAQYEALARAYGLYDMGLSGESWTEISHTFRSPMYYISYAAGMLAAVQLRMLAETDRDAACDAYRTVLMRPIGATFSNVIRCAGLKSPFDAESVRALAAYVKAQCAEEVG